MRKGSIPMKIVVLDIDGVLRSWPPPCPSYTNQAGRRVLSYNPMAIQALDWVLRETQARLVVSSTWRELGHVRLAQVLTDWGLQYPVHSLLRREYPSAYPGSDHWLANERTVQLKDWLSLYQERHPRETVRMVILDDEPTTHADGLLIQTDIALGLPWAQASQAVAYLQSEEHRGRQ
jgi:FMN phosphatase YigB (HAD superfamily)